MEVLHTNRTSFARYCCCFKILEIFDVTDIIVQNARKTCFRDITNLTEIDAFRLIFELNEKYGTQTELCGKNDYCSEPTTSSEIVFMCFWILLLIITVTSNLTVIMAIRHVPYLREITSNLLISSLAASDFLVGLFIIPIKIKYAYHNLRFCSPPLCRVDMTLDNWLFSTSITNLFFISIDRYLALNYPYEHRRYLTLKRCKYLICCIWLYSLLWGILCNVNWMHPSKPSVFIDASFACTLDNDAYVVSLTFLVFYIPAVTIAIVYIRVLRIARMHARAISDSIVIHNSRALQKEDSATTIHSTSSPGIKSKSESVPDEEENYIRITTNKDLNINEGESGVSSKAIQSLKYRKMNWKASKTVAIVYFTFFFCWFPITGLDLALIFCKDGFDPYSLRWFYYIFALAIPNIHSMVNPFIYGFMNKQYRRSYKRLFAQLKFKLTSKFNKYKEKAESVQPATVTK